MRDPVSVARLPLAIIAGILLLGSAGAAQLRRPVPMPPNLFNVIKLNDHLYIIAPSGPDTSNVGGNIGVCIADEGVLLVDANYNLDWRNGQAVPMAQSVVNEVKKLTPKPIRWVINTHHHGDHSGGDPVFRRVRHSRVAQERSRPDSERLRECGEERTSGREASRGRSGRRQRKRATPPRSRMRRIGSVWLR
jgi:glyoxylase-like metal-dependent hydrolase (beta-lactamase superfamily II)